MNNTTIYGNSKEGNGEPIDSAVDAIIVAVREGREAVIVQVRDSSDTIKKGDWFGVIPSERLDFAPFRFSGSFEHPQHESFLREMVGAFIRRNDAHTVFVRQELDGHYALYSVEPDSICNPYSYCNSFPTIDVRHAARLDASTTENLCNDVPIKKDELHPDQVALFRLYALLEKRMDRQAATDVVNELLNDGVVTRMASWWVENSGSPEDVADEKAAAELDDTQQRLINLQNNVNVLEARVEAHAAVLNAIVKKSENTLNGLTQYVERITELLESLHETIVYPHG